MGQVPLRVQSARLETIILQTIREACAQADLKQSLQLLRAAASKAALEKRIKSRNISSRMALCVAIRIPKSSEPHAWHSRTIYSSLTGSFVDKECVGIHRFIFCWDTVARAGLRQVSYALAEAIDKEDQVQLRRHEQRTRYRINTRKVRRGNVTPGGALT